jgi:Ca2+-binding EF-hand superfamily protein
MFTKLKLILATSVLVIGGAAGFAAAHGGGGAKGDRQGMKEKFDTNKDGKLDDSERAAMKAAMEAKRSQRKAEMLAKFDTNKDGKLDPAERAVMKQETSAAAFKKLDANGDGVLSRAEFAAADGRGHHGGMRKPH